MKIGFTGTRHGMTHAQKHAIRFLLALHGGAEFHHGGALGADEQASAIAVECRLILHDHLPIKQEAKFYLQRDREIVDATDWLIAAPKLAKEELRSGTWATVRYARKMYKPITIVWPNGMHENINHGGA